MALIDLTRQFSFTDARNRGLDIVDVILGLWGRDGTDQYPFAGLPGISTSLAGIQIGPQSELDRCWVTWNTGKTELEDNGPFIRRLSVQSPLLFSQPAGFGSNGPDAEGNGVTGAMLQGLLYVFPNGASQRAGNEADAQESTLLPATFAPYFSPVPLDSDPQPFLTKINNGTYNALPSPIIHLQLILNNTGLQLPTKRFPRTYRGHVTVTSDNGELMTIIPVHGRKTISVDVALNESCVWRIGALRNVNWQIGLSNQDLLSMEALVGEKTATNPYVTSFQFCDLGADFITIWCETAVIGAEMEYTVVVYD